MWRRDTGGVPPVPLDPMVGACTLTATALITMCALHPVVAIISLVGALLCSVVMRGISATMRGVRWQLPAIALVALANPFFTASGSTVVASLGPVTVYAEAIVYGLVAGCVMVASLVWLECLSELLPLSVVRAVLGRRTPTAALAVTMTLRLVPLLRDRYEQVAEARALNTAAGMRPPRSALVAAVTHSGVLLGWALEESLTRADSMTARGWGYARRRTSFVRLEPRLRDVIAGVLLVSLACACAFLVWHACDQWHFYPTMPHLVAWWGYVPFALLCALPSFVQLMVRLWWFVAERRSHVSDDMPCSAATQGWEKGERSGGARAGRGPSEPPVAQGGV